MRNIKLVVEYDGTDFVGWQTQRHGRTVQSEIANTLKQVLQEEVNVIGAGRTDAGVHARGQVANFRTMTALSSRSIYEALNGLLPHDICIHSADDVAEEFHSRFDARERTYTYTIAKRESAIGRQYMWFVKYRLDVVAMEECARILQGDHDFRAFCKAIANVSNHRCEVFSSTWSVDQGVFVYEIRANRFLHGMVRALVGTMVDVGRSHTSLPDFQAILGSGKRENAGMSAPPHGLVLESVRYD